MTTSPTRFLKKRAFDTPRDLVTAACLNTAMPDENRQSINSPESFAGVPLMEAARLAMSGWTGGNKVIDKLRVQIDQMIQASIPQPEVYYDVVGDIIDMGRYVEGEPECMMHIEDTGTLKRSNHPTVARLVFNIGVSGAVSRRTALLRGAAVIVLIDTLERHGTRVQVDLAYGVSNRLYDGDVLEYHLTIKQAHEYLSTNSLAFYLGHVSSIRRLMWALLEHEPDDVRRRFGIGREYGGSQGFPAQVEDRGDIYVDRILTNTDWSDAFTLLWIRSILTKQGINLTYLLNENEEHTEDYDEVGDKAIAALKGATT